MDPRRRLSRLVAPSTSRVPVEPASAVAPTTPGKTEIYSLFTKVGPTQLLHSAQTWVRITLRLETAGPVSAGHREDLVPVLSGKGTLLNDQDVVFTLPKGQRLFYAAEAVNRVRVIIEPIPWLEQILYNVERVVANLSPLKLLGNVFGGGNGNSPPTGRR